jgi:trimeric autotransporter adhesin
MIEAAARQLPEAQLAEALGAARDALPPLFAAQDALRGALLLADARAGGGEAGAAARFARRLREVTRPSPAVWRAVGAAIFAEAREAWRSAATAKKGRSALHGELVGAARSRAAAALGLSGSGELPAGAPASLPLQLALASDAVVRAALRAAVAEAAADASGMPRAAVAPLYDLGVGLGASEEGSGGGAVNWKAAQEEADAVVDAAIATAAATDADAMELAAAAEVSGAVGAGATTAAGAARLEEAWRAALARGAARVAPADAADASGGAAAAVSTASADGGAGFAPAPAPAAAAAAAAVAPCPFAVLDAPAGARPDGRGSRHLRPLSSMISALPPAVHGSSLFSRGDTQVLAAATLGPLDLASPPAEGVDPRGTSVVALAAEIPAPLVPFTGATASLAAAPGIGGAPAAEATAPEAAAAAPDASGSAPPAADAAASALLAPPPRAGKRFFLH